MKEELRKLSDRTSIKTQLVLLVGTSFTVVIIFIILFTYQRNSEIIIEQQTEKIHTLLTLENASLDEYLAEIDRFSLLLRNDGSFMQLIESEREFEYEDTSLVSTLLKSSFATRKDLISFYLYLIKTEKVFEIEATRRKVQSFTDPEIDELPGYDVFTKGKYYRLIEPHIEQGGFITFYRTIIKIQDQSPLAIVKLTMDNSYMDGLVSKYQDLEEDIYLFDSSNQMIYRQESVGRDERQIARMQDKVRNESNHSARMMIDKEEYLLIYNNQSSYGNQILLVKPLREIEGQLVETRNISIVIAVVAIMVTVLMAYIIISLVVNPLRKLAMNLKEVGSGDFKHTLEAGGSLEIVELTGEYNLMIQQIDRLIKETYVSKLNEKTSKLAALEAQLNPHFLYNALQAISSEALMNGQEQINYMVGALAGLLRYTIKGGDLVQLSDEVRYVKDYLLLQKARFEENLQYDIYVEDGVDLLLIPKISIQLLVENSIVHGMKGEKVGVYIQIQCYLKDERLHIVVKDDGNGMLKEEKEQIEESFGAQEKQRSSIGLYNLAHRLDLLYRQQATIRIETKEGQGTTVILTIPKMVERGSL